MIFNPEITVYVLRCQKKRWYVGKTSDFDPMNRLIKHQKYTQQQKKKFTYWYKPIKIQYKYCIDNADQYDEDKVVKMLMFKFGIDNVRGGSYLGHYTHDFKLSDIQKISLEKQLNRNRNDRNEQERQDAQLRSQNVLVNFSEIKQEPHIMKQIEIGQHLRQILDGLNKLQQEEEINCFKCDQIGHLAIACPNRRTSIWRETQKNKKEKFDNSNNSIVEGFLKQTAKKYPQKLIHRPNYTNIVEEEQEGTRSQESLNYLRRNNSHAKVRLIKLKNITNGYHILDNRSKYLRAGEKVHTAQKALSKTDTAAIWIITQYHSQMGQYTIQSYQYRGKYFNGKGNWILNEIGEPWEIFRDS